MSRKTAITVLDEESLLKAVRALCRREPRFRSVVRRHGPPSLRTSAGGLAALLQMVTEQFISVAAAKVIWARLLQRLQPCDAQTLLSCSEEELMALGLSRAKARSFHGLARAVHERAVVFDALAEMTDEAAHNLLIGLPGIGPWTADIYLLSALQRADAWPWGDMALQVAAQDLFGLEERPGRAAMLELGEAFRPHRAVAARLLWSHYRFMRNQEQV